MDTEGTPFWFPSLLSHYEVLEKRKAIPDDRRQSGNDRVLWHERSSSKTRSPIIADSSNFKTDPTTGCAELS